MQKRLMAINDISCLGKCSLTVALPVISACGIEVCPVPTAILSTHTGGFAGYSFKDLSEDIGDITSHWETLKLQFDGIYSGYLGSISQIEYVKDTIKKFKSEKTLIVVDPVMGDFGRLYAGFTEDFVEEMVSLCKEADVITPNITEACFMTKTPYKEPPFTNDYIETLMEKLKKICSKNIVLTGVSFDNKTMGSAIFDGKEIKYIFAEKLEGRFHGTGDVFASSFVGAYMSGKSLIDAAATAVNFVVDCIKKTMETKDIHYGVEFEKCIPKLLEYVGLI